MARINLLPWRAELRKKKLQEFAFAAGFAGAAMLALVGAGHLYFDGKIDSQTKRNDFVKTEIKKVEKEIEEIANLEKQKQELVARMKVIEQLQRNRPTIVQLFDELVKVTPDAGLYMTSLIQVGTRLNIEGIAQSNARVSELMRKLEESPLLENAVLEIIQTEKKDAVRKFKLNVTQVAMPTVARPEKAAATDGQTAAKPGSAAAQPGAGAEQPAQAAPQAGQATAQVEQTAPQPVQAPVPNSAQAPADTPVKTKTQDSGQAEN